MTRKITRAVARITLGLQDKLYLGNMDALRDWGFAGDYVEAMWRIVQAEKADDYVIATGEMHTVREFVEAAFARAGVRVAWQGRGVEEVGVDADGALGERGRILVAVDARYFRPAEVEQLLGDPTKAREDLGWKPRVTFQKLVEMMVDADLAEQKRELYLRDGGYEVKNYFE